jgi:hypothetical protein
MNKEASGIAGAMEDEEPEGFLCQTCQQYHLTPHTAVGAPMRFYCSQECFDNSEYRTGNVS